MRGPAGAQRHQSLPRPRAVGGVVGVTTAPTGPHTSCPRLEKCRPGPLRDPEPLITNELEVSSARTGLPTGSEQGQRAVSDSPGSPSRSHLRSPAASNPPGNCSAPFRCNLSAAAVGRGRHGVGQAGSHLQPAHRSACAKAPERSASIARTSPRAASTARCSASEAMPSRRTCAYSQSKPGARWQGRPCSVSPDFSPNPPCTSQRNGLSTASAVRLVVSMGWGSCCRGIG